jgi:hypothetical protein
VAPPQVSLPSISTLRTPFGCLRWRRRLSPSRFRGHRLPAEPNGRAVALRRHASQVRYLNQHTWLDRWHVDQIPVAIPTQALRGYLFVGLNGASFQFRQTECAARKTVGAVPIFSREGQREKYTIFSHRSPATRSDCHAVVAALVHSSPTPRMSFAHDKSTLLVIGLIPVLRKGPGWANGAVRFDGWVTPGCAGDRIVG